MRIPLARYGLREIILGSAMCLGAIVVSVWLFPPVAVLPALAWIFLIAFFRDPSRSPVGSEH